MNDVNLPREEQQPPCWLAGLPLPIYPNIITSGIDYNQAEGKVAKTNTIEEQKELPAWVLCHAGSCSAIYSSFCLLFTVPVSLFIQFSCMNISSVLNIACLVIQEHDV
ncbi:EspG domain-containing protein [Escherichia coli]|uniref:EspG domain-containing protein n=1 Tax=Escherichia coli TaxID=562 RepID=UPI000F0AB2DB|nr:hypothetical protein [Escherichia coli]QKB35838.1 hypothetical protein E3156_26850 [Escherichia coli O55:H7]EGK3838913.1 hypothetical protein [Escherichia coli]EHK8332201.1 hypothetical protein [Escherichia coli]EHW3014146.1 hypothetical protein [Escherichia coli]